MKEPHGADTLEDNLGNPMAPLLYAVQHAALHDGVARPRRRGDRHRLRRAARPRRMLAEAGFARSRCTPRPAIPATRSTWLGGEPSLMWLERLAGGRSSPSCVPRGGCSWAGDRAARLLGGERRHQRPRRAHRASSRLRLGGVGVSGAVTIVFALGRSARARPRGVAPRALAPGLDNLSDAFFRLDCRVPRTTAARSPPRPPRGTARCISPPPSSRRWPRSPLRSCSRTGCAAPSDGTTSRARPASSVSSSR